MSKSPFVLALYLFISYQSYGQQNNIWYFGLKGGIDFNTIPGSPSPVAIGNSAMLADEGCGSICDKNGKLLFYSNGVTVYNWQHEVMLNGDMPTGFTPNNDGLNDIVKPIITKEFALHQFAIYNRWGQKIFTTSEKNAGWNGKLNGILQDSGVYVWMINATDTRNNKKYDLKGTFVIIRK